MDNKLFTSVSAPERHVFMTPPMDSSSYKREPISSVWMELLFLLLKLIGWIVGIIVFIAVYITVGVFMLKALGLA